MYARLVIRDMMVTFLSVLGTTPTFSRIARYLGLWEGQDLLGASFEKQKVVVARQALAPPLACQQPR